MFRLIAVGLAAFLLLIGCRQNDSPRGRIAFMSIDGDQRGIHVIKADGSGEVTLTDNGQWPVWSPDGSKIAFLRFIDEENAEVFVINADGTGEMNVSNTVDQVEESFAWAPDGTKLAFLSSPMFPVTGPPKIQVVNADGSGRHLHTGTPAWSFAWAPDSTRIAYVVLRDESSSLGFTTDLYVANVDGSDISLVTQAPLGDDQQIGSVTWTPDGRSIVFDAYRHYVFADRFESSESVVYRLAVDGSSLKQLTQSEAQYGAPLLSPNGRRIAVSDGNDGIWSMRDDGSGLRDLTQLLVAGQPTWSPDSKYIAFKGRMDTAGTIGGDLFILNATGAARRITRITEGSRVEAPAWAPR